MTSKIITNDDGTCHAEVFDDAGELIFTSRPFAGSDKRAKAQQAARWFQGGDEPKQKSLF